MSIVADKYINIWIDEKRPSRPKYAAIATNPSIKKYVSVQQKHSRPQRGTQIKYIDSRFGLHSHTEYNK